MELINLSSAGEDSKTLTGQRPENLVIQGAPEDIEALNVEDQTHGNIVRLDGDGIQAMGSVGVVETGNAYVLPLGDGQAESTITINIRTAGTISGNVKVFANSTGLTGNGLPVVYQMHNVQKSTSIRFSDFFAVAFVRTGSERVSVTGSVAGVTSQLGSTEVRALNAFKGAYQGINAEVVDNTDQSITEVQVQAAESDMTVYVSRLKVV